MENIAQYVWIWIHIRITKTEVMKDTWGRDKVGETGIFEDSQLLTR